MAIALVNTSENVALSAGTTIASPATSLTTGNCLIVGIYSGNTNSVSSITDTAGNLYRRVASQNVSGTSTLDLWYASDVIGDASNIVTATYAASVPSRSIVTAQFSGLATQSVLDVFSTGTASGATVTAAAITTTVAEAVLIAVCSINNVATTWTAGSGYTIAVQDSSNVVVLQYDIVSSLQSAVTPSASNSDAANLKIIVAAAFNAPTGFVQMMGGPVIVQRVGAVGY